MLTQQGWGGPQESLRLDLCAKPRDQPDIAQIQCFTEGVIVPTCNIFQKLKIREMPVDAFPARLMQWPQKTLRKHLQQCRCIAERMALTIVVDLSHIRLTSVSSKWRRTLAFGHLADVKALLCGQLPVQAPDWRLAVDLRKTESWMHLDMVLWTFLAPAALLCFEHRV